jgi:hypothetical protein
MSYLSSIASRRQNVVRVAQITASGSRPMLLRSDFITPSAKTGSSVTGKNRARSVGARVVPRIDFVCGCQQVTIEKIISAGVLVFLPD